MPDPSTAVRDLRHALMPRRLAGLDSRLPLTIAEDTQPGSLLSTKLLVSSAEEHPYPPVASFSSCHDHESHLEAATMATQSPQQQQHRYFPVMRMRSQYNECPKILNGHSEELGGFAPASVICPSKSLQYGAPMQYSGLINSSPTTYLENYDDAPPWLLNSIENFPSAKAEK